MGVGVHDSDTSLGGQIVGDPTCDVFLQREGIEGSKDSRHKSRPDCQHAPSGGSFPTYVPIRIQRATGSAGDLIQNR
jgi:hypothetical protein